MSSNSSQNVQGSARGLLFAALITGILLIAFGLIAAAANRGHPLAFDQAVAQIFKSSANPSTPIGAQWIQSAARDLTALGSHTVLGIVLFTVCGYLMLVGQRAAALLMLAAVIGAAFTTDLLKLEFARPRPGSISPSVPVFSPSFPSGHAGLSASTYLSLGALLARIDPRPRVSVFFMSTAAAVTFLIGLSTIILGSTTRPTSSRAGVWVPRGD